ncbi:unnamed protein product [Diplocarpon coronariae]
MADIPAKNASCIAEHHEDFDGKRKTVAIKIIIAQHHFSGRLLLLHLEFIRLVPLREPPFLAEPPGFLHCEQFWDQSWNRQFHDPDWWCYTTVPFVGPAIDTLGRRIGMWIGASITIMGVTIQGTIVDTNNISHPAYRGIVTSFYNVFWPVGALVASSACRGSLILPGHASWLVPVLFQAMFLGVFFITALNSVVAESAKLLPKWLYTNRKQEQEKSFLTKWHGNGNSESEWVKLQMWEYEAHLEMDGADKHWRDYRALFRNRTSIYRLACNCCVSLLGQWAGTVKDTKKKNDLFVVMNALQCIVSFAGSTLVNQSGFPVTMPDIEWKKYIVFTVWCLIQAALIYYSIPETKNRTLEELDEIFGAQNLMKASIAKKKLELDQNANIIAVVDLSKDGVSA